ncbi:trafficking protein Mon1-domain-containing protein [Scheffersomyces xylosifermentans]|uniref:trafficking protein Mon1-domain-containing protein n=1 Tax=Scheffersomyces xylosifermentans TaxID=1304137 RepID=UPI00315CB91D
MKDVHPKNPENSDQHETIKFNTSFISPSKLVSGPSISPAKFPSVPTTAVNLENAGSINAADLLPSQSSHTSSTEVPDSSHLRVANNHSSGRFSLASENSYVPSIAGLTSEDEEDDREDNNIETSHNEEEDLQSILNGLIRHENHFNGQISHRNSLSSPRQEISFLDLNIFPNSETVQNGEEYYNKYIRISKDEDEAAFVEKLKHFFILSSAGKPVFSMHGADDIIMGYMGIITTIVSTFEENMKEEIKSITVGDRIKIVAINKNPLILVAVSQISYEMMSFTHNESVEEELHPRPNSLEDHDSDSDDLILINQLNTLYNYLLSILSKPTIEKNFHNRMNYDLRRVLTPLDFHNFEALCLKLTYGLPLLKEGEKISDTSSFDFYIGELLDSSIQSVKIRNTTRNRLNNIFLSCKRIKVKEDDLDSEVNSDSVSFFSKAEDQERYLGEDLLFSFLTTSSNRILSFMKPRNHTLSNEDLKILFSMISSAEMQSGDSEFTEDLWIPLCMPNFNPNGFLYVFVRKFDLSEYVEPRPTVSQPLSIILISSNKNTFFKMREISRYIITKIVKGENSRNNPLSRELLESTKLSILNDIRVPAIKHFIYKLKCSNQFIMNDMVYYNNDRSMNTLLQLVYFYSILHNSKATKIKSKLKATYNHETGLVRQINSSRSESKKLTYTRWNGAGTSVTGFMLSDDVYEFYCLSNEEIGSKDLIANSLKIIQWCEKYRKRLFLGEGVTF